MSKREKPKKEKKPTRSYQFRLYPTRKQEQKLEGWLVVCCETYKASLDERKSAYRMVVLSLSYEDQCAELPDSKQLPPELAAVPSQALQDVVQRLDLSHA